MTKLFNEFIHYLIQIVKSALNLSFTLFKLMIPIIIVIKILEEYGFIIVLSEWLSPLMELLGLPGAMGLVWATTLITNLYGGLVVYASLAADTPMTMAQITILSSMMLIAHALPIEARIAQKAGVNIIVTVFLRLGMAILIAVIYNQFYLLTNWLQQPAELLWTPEIVDHSFFSWLQNQIVNLLLIFIIVLVLVLLLDVLKRLGVIQQLNNILRPVLHVLGIGREAETITLVGVTLGLSYGGALLINEAEAGHIKPRDVLFSMSLLGLSHSQIEDTLLMLLIGADLSGILIGRILFSLIVIFMMVKLINRFSSVSIDRYFVKSVC